MRKAGFHPKKGSRGALQDPPGSLSFPGLVRLLPASLPAWSQPAETWPIFLTTIRVELRPGASMP